MKKILILVMSSPQIDIYYEMMKKQKETWDSVNVDGVQTLFFYGDENVESSHISQNNLIIKTSDATINMSYKVKLVYDFIFDMNWDYIFRTNASSYIDKRRLFNKAQTLPTTKCYCGIKITLDDYTAFSSGAGTFYSRDCIDIIRNNITEEHKMNSEIEDVFEGKILKNVANIGVTPGAMRSDYTHNDFEKFMKNITFTDTNPYHYRCRSLCQRGTICEERKKEPIAFDKIFNYLKK